MLPDQDRALWDLQQIRRGLKALARASELGGARGIYALQAAIVACHAEARSASETDWRRIASLYTELFVLMPSPVVELNRAVAIGMSEGPAAGLEIVERLMNAPALRTYHLLPSVRGDFLQKLGRDAEACSAFEAAAALAGNRREHEMLKQRAADLTRCDRS